MTKTDLVRLHMTDLMASDQVIPMNVIEVDLKALPMAVCLFLPMALMKVHLMTLFMTG